MFILLSSYTACLDVPCVISKTSYYLKNHRRYPGTPDVSGCGSEFLRSVRLQELRWPTAFAGMPRFSGNQPRVAPTSPLRDTGSRVTGNSPEVMPQVTGGRSGSGNPGPATAARAPGFGL